MLMAVIQNACIQGVSPRSVDELVKTVSVARREVLGLTVMPSEAEAFRSDFLRSLTRRGHAACRREMRASSDPVFQDTEGFVAFERPVANDSATQMYPSAMTQRVAPIASMSFPRLLQLRAFRVVVLLFIN